MAHDRKPRLPPQKGIRMTRTGIIAARAALWRARASAEMLERISRIDPDTPLHDATGASAGAPRSEGGRGERRHGDGHGSAGLAAAAGAGGSPSARDAVAAAVAAGGGGGAAGAHSAAAPPAPALGMRAFLLRDVVAYAVVQHVLGTGGEVYGGFVREHFSGKMWRDIDIAFARKESIRLFKQTLCQRLRYDLGGDAGSFVLTLVRVDKKEQYATRVDRHELRCRLGACAADAFVIPLDVSLCRAHRVRNDDWWPATYGSMLRMSRRGIGIAPRLFGGESGDVGTPGGDDVPGCQFEDIVGLLRGSRDARLLPSLLCWECWGAGGAAARDRSARARCAALEARGYELLDLNGGITYERYRAVCDDERAAAAAR